MDNVKHYMWKNTNEGYNPPGNNDIESRFPGLRYSACTGLNDKGKRTNVHIEKHANSDTLRVWQGADVTREATTITFTLYFIGDNRQEVYDDFYEYISNGKIFYWDNVRKKEALLIFTDSLKPKEDIYKGSIPYILADFKFQNLYGECEDKDY